VKTAKPLLFILAASLAFFVFAEWLYTDIAGFGWRKAKDQYSEYGKKLGLEYKGPEFDYQIGQLLGTYRNHEVRVLPDEQARIEVRLEVSNQVNLSTQQSHDVNSHAGMEWINSRYPSFNNFFATRYASPVLALQLADAKQLAEFLEVFQRKWGRPMEYLIIDDTSLVISMRYGWQTYIPVDVVESLLPDLISLAETIEAL
jgi:hypothetical protein